jgi:S1-C subfamily serine protease
LVANVVTGDTNYLWLNSAVQRSDILRSVDQVFPPLPPLFARVRSFLNSEGFPAVFATLSGPNASRVHEPTDTQARHLGGLAAFSTVKIVGTACGYQQEGSGFVVGHGLVATNAHVVAGETQTEIVVGDTGYRATVVSYDPSFDLALLRTRAPLGPALTVDSQPVSRGTEGAVLGYPENGPLTVGPAGVAASVEAQGRDIYDNGLVTRSVYEIDASIRPGNSGGPLMGPNGQVIGVVFSRSTVAQGIGYALASPDVRRHIDAAAGHTAAVSTGGCVQG